MTYREASELFFAWTLTESLRRHGRAVELAMRRLALDGDGDMEQFAIAGLLHDGDYEQWPEEHPSRMVQWLEDRGEAALAYAISCHYSKWNRPCKSRLDACLLSADEAAGFVCACALVRPDGIATLTAQSVKKKLKDKSFAAKVDRDEIQLGCKLLGTTIDDHMTLIIEALKPHAAELGLEGHAK